MKKILLTIFAFVMALTVMAEKQKYVGGDISLLPSYENYNTPYYDANGAKISNVLTWMHETCGWNTFRVRLFVNPTDPNKEGVVQDLAYVKKLGKRIKDAGAFFMLDFHYSDTWVDATHIQAPAAWKGLSDAAMADTLGKYTAYVLEELKAYGATPDLVQVGNEIMYGLCGIQVHPYASSSDNWTGYANLLKAGCNAVREHCPDAKIIIHTDRPTNSSYNNFYYRKLIDMGVDYDVIGLSYYPFWHGYLTPAQVVSKSDKNNLVASVVNLANNFPDKEVQIVETAYNYQYWPTSGVNYNTQDVWACSVAGQYNFIKDLVAELSTHSNVTGISYWFPEENGCGGPTWSESTIVIKSWLNRGLWDDTTHKLNKLADKSNVPQLLGTFLPEPTALPSTVVEQSATKTFEGGKLIITRGGSRYTADGQLVY